MDTKLPMASHFNPRSPHGERPCGKRFQIKRRRFQSTLPARGATDAVTIVSSGGRVFQSTLPARGATGTPARLACSNAFQSTLPARGATTLRCNKSADHRISIHAPRTGSDRRRRSRPPPTGNFNPRSPHGERRKAASAKAVETISIHAPRTGSDVVSVSVAVGFVGFQSTLPARGATGVIRAAKQTRNQFQSTLPARGATSQPPLFPMTLTISIHAPRTGSDELPVIVAKTPVVFQSTLPARGATCPHSISLVTAHNFNPRSPHGERRARPEQEDTMKQFQSTLPARGATAHARKPGRRTPYFNPRSPHGERRRIQNSAPPPAHFNPRSPHGERRLPRTPGVRALRISIHAPRTGSDIRVTGRRTP